jgi:SAM-dependent methyltransferase
MITVSNLDLVAARTLLQPAHDLYISTISPQGMALSLETSALAWVLCNQRRPTSVLDLGSGFSSYVLRRAAQNIGCPVVWSVDDDEAWLPKSREFCEKQGVRTDNFVPWSTFKDSDLRFDLVIYDLGRMPARFANLVQGLGFMKPGGCVIIDDMHKFNYHKTVVKTLIELGLTGTDMRASTTDKHEGRHCWLAT